MHQYDLVIIGGGLVGGSLACALGGLGLRLCVVEALPRSVRAEPSYDERVIALAWGSRLILEGIGLWPAIAPEAVAIERVHVSDRGHFGFARLDCGDAGLEALGYVTPARLLGHAIEHALERAEGVEVLAPAKVLGLRVDDLGAELEVVENGASRLLRARLVVAADGGDSAVRRRLDIPVRERGYGQDALITTITAERPRPGVAFERFTDSGPLALLPLSKGRYSVVWTAREAETAGLLPLSDREFCERLQARFGWRVGRLTHPARRLAYPLKLLLAEDSIRPRLVLIGNAAHTLHPVAGQGLNLGLRDVAALAEVVADAARVGADPGTDAVLDGYRRLRGRDQSEVAWTTDALAWLFVNPWLPVRFARDLGMLGLDLMPAARRLVARRFMGLGNSRPRLVRGLALGGKP
ncbi:MAG: 2-octaprenyl-6-methoxyphenyl hydroxylase [Chromatiaceae bacterium]|jgi:2-octaprenyl-6-methoxyphenol hydroxylase|nr:2-octaprenyl-6-methoxyphenyl hydroxylase [Chromatiaceae bacterium]